MGSSVNLNSQPDLIARLRRGSKTRQYFVASHLSKTLAFQVRALRDKRGWTQKDLGEHAGSTQNGVYKLESMVGSPTLTTLKKIAAAFDVALIVRFVPFSELVDWVSGRPRVERGLRSSSFTIAPFLRGSEIGGRVARRSIERFEQRLKERIAQEERELEGRLMDAHTQRVRVEALKSALEELQMAPDEKESEP